METLCDSPKIKAVSSMNLDQRLKSMIDLGSLLISKGGIPDEVARRAKVVNPWFTQENIQKSILEISESYLNEDKLKEWLGHYLKINSYNSTKRVGLLLAGNIPLVGFHDILCTYLAGHQSKIKPSERDTIVLDYLIEQLISLDSRNEAYFEKVERLSDYEAVIATGSDSSGRYFKKYFSHVPHIIRMNRNGVAVIYNDTTDQALAQLGGDIFSYFGLGCRNVSKVYLEEGFDVQRIFKGIEKHRDIIHHHKYKNNYDYNFAMYLLNKEDFLTNDFIVFRQHKDIGSRIAALHYENFSDQTTLQSQLNSSRDQIQCVISDRPIEGFNIFDFGKAQMPDLMDYADGVDTMKFLLSL